MRKMRTITPLDATTLVLTEKILIYYKNHVFGAIT